MKLDLLLFALVALLPPAASAQQTVKISAPLAPETRSGRVSDYLFTHDGTRVVYRDDRFQANQFELFSRPLDGSAPSVRLNGPLHAQGSVGYSNYTGSFAVGAQDQVVYWAEEIADDVSELYLVPADGSASRIRISGPGESVRYVRLDPAGTRAFYQDGGSEEPVGPLRVVPLDGSAPPLVLSAADVRGSWLSPDGATLVFAATVPSASQRQDLFVMPSDGSAPPLFLARTQPFPAGTAWFDDLVFTADGSRVVYNEHDYDFDDIRLYATHSVPLDGSAAPTLLVGSDWYYGLFRLVPDAVPERVVSLAFGRLDSITTTGALATTLSLPGSSVSTSAYPLVVGPDVVFGGSSIFRVPADGSLPAMALCACGSGVNPVLASPTTVAFASYTSSAYQLHAVPFAGGAALPLHPLPPPFRGTRGIFPHPDGQRVLYTADMETGVRTELYVVPLDASQPPLKLSPPLETIRVRDVRLTPDATQVAFTGGPANGGPNELYLAPVDGSAPALHVNEPVASGIILGDVTSFQLTPDETGVVYRADLDADEDFDLVSVDELGVAQRLGDGTGSVLASYALTPDSTRAVFETLVGGQHALRVAELAGLAGGAALTLDSGAQEFLAPYRFAAGRVVYRKAMTSSANELRSVALDALSPPVVLHGPLTSFASVGEFRVGPAGVVVFLGDLVTDGKAELWATPVAGGSPPVRLSPALVTGGSVTSVELDASGTWAVFLADAHVNNRFELYGVPVDGSRAARRLSGALPTLGDVMEFSLTADGERVVYRADQLADQRFDLFSVPLGGSPPRHARPGGTAPARTTLLSALPPGRAVQADWKLSPDGSEVVYRANATDVAVLELLRVRVDGSTPPVVLSGALPPTADVTTFRIAPDQSRVAFVADSRLDAVLEPFSVPLLGGAIVPLAQLPSFASMTELRIEASSHGLVYTAAAEVAGRVDVYRVPLDGSAQVRRLNPPTPNGDVLTDFLPLPVGVLYRADQQLDEVYELYLSF